MSQLSRQKTHSYSIVNLLNWSFAALRRIESLQRGHSRCILRWGMSVSNVRLADGEIILQVGMGNWYGCGHRGGLLTLSTGRNSIVVKNKMATRYGVDDEVATQIARYGIDEVIGALCRYANKHGLEKLFIKLNKVYDEWLGK